MSREHDMFKGNLNPGRTFSTAQGRGSKPEKRIIQPMKSLSIVGGFVAIHAVAS